VIFIELEILTELWQKIPIEAKWTIFAIGVIFFVCRLAAELYSAFKVKGLKGVIEKLKEIDELRDSRKFVQDFTDSNIKKEYRYNATTKELVETGGTIDTQKIIDSHRATSLEAMLDKYMPVETAEAVAVANYSRSTDRLDELAKLIETGNKYRDEFGLADDVSITDIYKMMQKRSETLKSDLDKLTKLKEVTNNEKKIEQEKQ
jgi:hypothetical protein